MFEESNRFDHHACLEIGEDMTCECDCHSSRTSVANVVLSRNGSVSTVSGNGADVVNVVLMPSEISEVESAFKKLSEYVPMKKYSLLKKYLTSEVFEKLKTRVTSNGAKLMDVIRSGVCVLESSCGVYAPDGESYRVFNELFDPIIREYHQVGATVRQPEVDFGDIGFFKENVDLEGRYVSSVRIRCARNLKGFGMHPVLQREDYIRIEELVTDTLCQIEDEEMQGTYFPIAGMSEETIRNLINEGLLFEQEDACLKTARASEFWPTGRGIFYNPKKTAVVWVNEEDQLRLISIEKGCDFEKIYKRFVDLVTFVGQKLELERDIEYGYVTFCPTNLGTSIRASAMIKLPLLAKNRPKLDEVCKEMNLQVRGMHGEHSTQDGIDTFDISNKRRLGITEFEAVRDIYIGTQKLIQLEKSLEKISQQDTGDKETGEVIKSRDGETEEVVKSRDGETEEVVKSRDGDTEEVVGDRETEEIVRSRDGETEEVVGDRETEEREVVGDGETEVVVGEGETEEVIGEWGDRANDMDVSGMIEKTEIDIEIMREHTEWLTSLLSVRARLPTAGEKEVRDLKLSVERLKEKIYLRQEALKNSRMAVLDTEHRIGVWTGLLEVQEDRLSVYEEKVNIEKQTNALLTQLIELRDSESSLLTRKSLTDRKLLQIQCHYHSLAQQRASLQKKIHKLKTAKV